MTLEDKQIGLSSQSGSTFQSTASLLDLGLPDCRWVLSELFLFAVACWLAKLDSWEACLWGAGFKGWGAQCGVQTLYSSGRRLTSCLGAAALGLWFMVRLCLSLSYLFLSRAFSRSPDVEELLSCFFVFVLPPPPGGNCFVHSYICRSGGSMAQGEFKFFLCHPLVTLLTFAWIFSSQIEVGSKTLGDLA